MAANSAGGEGREIFFSLLISDRASVVINSGERQQKQYAANQLSCLREYFMSLMNKVTHGERDPDNPFAETPFETPADLLILRPPV